MAEHWLYVPAIGFFVAVAYGVSRLKILAIPIMIFFSAMTIYQNQFWKEPHAFYNRTLQYNPESIRALYNLANFKAEKGEFAEAEKLYQRAIVLNTSYPQAYHNLGVLYAQEGRYREAKALFQKVLEISPGDPDALENLSKLPSN